MNELQREVKLPGIRKAQVLTYSYMICHMSKLDVRQTHT